MTKIVINKKHGGFSLSAKAEMLYAKVVGFEIYRYEQKLFSHESGKNLYVKVPAIRDVYFSYVSLEDLGESVNEMQVSALWYSFDIKRDDPVLIRVIEELGEEASTSVSDLKIVEIPDGVEWEICEYDGLEWVAEKHRVWH